MKGLIIDNFDSFTYNLYQYLGTITNDTIDVRRNNAISISEIKKNKYDYIVLSPGPGHPKNQRDFGICKNVLLNVSKKVPTLGICLGHQGIAYTYGGNVVLANEPNHGKTSIISHNKKDIFKNVPENLEVGRYHSLIIEKESLPTTFEILATTKDQPNIIMAIKHKKYPIYGVQFHPESILTIYGLAILKNFIQIVKLEPNSTL